jgi:hypothetical protein
MGDKPNRKNSRPELPGLGVGLTTPTLEKTLVTKSEEAITGYFSWQKLLRNA